MGQSGLALLGLGSSDLILKFHSTLQDPERFLRLMCHLVLFGINSSSIYWSLISKSFQTFPDTTGVEFMARWSNLCQHTVAF